MNILVFGDSITQGFDDTEKGGWVNRLFVALSARHAGQGHDDFHTVFNLGISGDTTDALLLRVGTEISARADDKLLIIFDIGGNDCVRNLVTNECQVSLKKFIENYRNLILLGKAHGSVVCLGLHDSNELQLNPIPHYKDHACLQVDHDLYDAEVRRLTAEHAVTYVPMTGMLSEDFTKFTYDGDHPSAIGHEMIFTRVMDTLANTGMV